jgi:hypothetical protein
MVDRALLAAKIAAVEDAEARIQSTLPAEVDAFLADRTAREVVLLNLFVAIQECIALAAHWLADEGRTASSEIPAALPGSGRARFWIGAWRIASPEASPPSNSSRSAIPPEPGAPWLRSPTSSSIAAMSIRSPRPATRGLEVGPAREAQDLRR